MRYNLMNYSNQKEDKHNKYYYDILTASYDMQTLLHNSTEHELVQTEINRLDLFFTEIYGSMKYMDIVLHINNIEHRSILHSGDVIKLPQKKILDNYLRERH